MRTRIEAKKGGPITEDDIQMAFENGDEVAGGHGGPAKGLWARQCFRTVAGWSNREMLSLSLSLSRMQYYPRRVSG